jgi:hypothetical protein
VVCGGTVVTGAVVAGAVVAGGAVVGLAWPLQLNTAGPGILLT